MALTRFIQERIQTHKGGELMNKDFAKSKIATAASRQGYTVQTRAGKDFDEIRILNASKEIVASGTLALDTKGGYVASDISTVISQIQTKLGVASKKVNASRKSLNSGCHGKKINAAEEDDYTADMYDDDYIEDDAEFVEDVESVVTDESGNEVVVDEMLVVQDPETKEISLFVPEDEEDTVPENVEVIGEVTSTEDSEVLDSSRHFIKRSVRASRKRKMNAARVSRQHTYDDPDLATDSATPRLIEEAAKSGTKDDLEVDVQKLGQKFRVIIRGSNQEAVDNAMARVDDFVNDWQADR